MREGGEGEREKERECGGRAKHWTQRKINARMTRKKEKDRNTWGEENRGIE